MPERINCRACPKCGTLYHDNYSAERCCPNEAVDAIGWETVCGFIWKDKNGALLHEDSCKTCKSLLPRTYGKE